MLLLLLLKKKNDWHLFPPSAKLSDRIVFFRRSFPVNSVAAGRGSPSLSVTINWPPYEESF